MAIRKSSPLSEALEALEALSAARAHAAEIEQAVTVYRDGLALALAEAEIAYHAAFPTAREALAIADAANVAVKQAEIEAKNKTLVLLNPGENLRSGGLIAEAILRRGWSLDKLDGYSVAHPEINAMREDTKYIKIKEAK